MTQAGSAQAVGTRAIVTDGWRGDHPKTELKAHNASGKPCGNHFLRDGQKQCLSFGQHS